MAQFDSESALDVVKYFYKILEQEFKEAPYTEQEKQLLNDKHLYYGNYLDPRLRNYFSRAVFSPIADGLNFFDIPDSRPMRILDLGCGLGMQSFIFASQGASVTGIDLRPQSIELCRKRKAYLEEKTGRTLNVDFQLCDFSQIDASDFPEKYDAAFSMSAFSYIPPLEKTVQTLLSLLNENSRVFLYEENIASIPGHFKNREQLPTPREVRSVFRQAGFETSLLRGACVLPKVFWKSEFLSDVLIEPLNRLLRNSLMLSFNYTLGMQRTS